MIELLAPAGTREALTAAVENGADAVYLAGNRFGARAYAENFDETSMREAIRYAHLRGVAVHVTVNTAVDESELPALTEFLRFLVEAEADAALVQDLGVLRIAREAAPRLPLHASTQMTAHNLAGVLELEALGFSRVVLAREMTLDEIRYICENSHAEIEVFAHGALCVCYSGQCLMSSMIGGRSGNRGRCAQPCRLPYTLVDEKGEDVLENTVGQYLLSPRDLNTIEILKELTGAGVASLKIEGRMKRPEYVAVVTAAYRRELDALRDGRDGTADGETRRRLAQVFNRDFTTAYLLDNPGRNLMSDRRPNNRGLLVGRVVSYDRETTRVRVKLTETVTEGDQVDCWVKVGGRVTETVRDMRNSRGDATKSGAAGDEVSFAFSRAVHPNDRLFRVYDAALMEEARTSYIGSPKRRVPVHMIAAAAKGKPFSVRISSADGYCAEAHSSFLCQEAKNRPLTRETLEKQITRTGATVYEIAELEAHVEDGVMVPMSVMNEVRREATKHLDEARLAGFRVRRQTACEASAKALSKIISTAASIKMKNFRRENADARPRLMLAADTLEKARAALEAGADGILFGGDAYDHHFITREEYREAFSMVREMGRLIVYGTPRILRERFVGAWTALLEALDDAPADALCVHNIGALRLAREHSVLPIQSDFSWIVYNASAIRQLRDMGVSWVTLSPELNFQQIETVAGKSVLPTECLVHGRIELMISAYCAMGSFLGEAGASCSAPCMRGRFALRDRMGERFPLVIDAGCNMHVLNAKTLSMLPHIGRFVSLGVNRLRIDGRFMTAREIGETVSAYREFLSYGEILSEKQKARAEAIEGKDITRGHYFRGVL